MNADNNTTKARNNAVNSITGERDDYIINLQIPSSVYTHIRCAIHSVIYYDYYPHPDDRLIQMYKEIDDHLKDDYWISFTPLDGDSDE